MVDNFEVSTVPERLNVEMIHGFLTRSYWSEGRTREEVERSIRHGLCFGAYDGDKQIGFARIVSDYLTFAYIMDVFTLPEYQGKGIGKLLMNEVLAYPDLQGISRWILKTKDAHEFYRKLGFEEIDDPEYWMQKKQPGL